MKEIILIVEIIFLDIAKENFNFPIMNNLRTSFWLLNSELSTFSELQLLDKEVNIWEKNTVLIKIIERDFLKEKLYVGCEFKLGVYPKEMAYGRVVEIKISIPKTSIK
jgi:hypothetical protein